MNIDARGPIYRVKVSEIKSKGSEATVAGQSDLIFDTPQDAHPSKKPFIYANTQHANGTVIIAKRSNAPHDLL